MITSVLFIEICASIGLELIFDTGIRCEFADAAKPEKNVEIWLRLRGIGRSA